MRNVKIKCDLNKSQIKFLDNFCKIDTDENGNKTFTFNGTFEKIDEQYYYNSVVYEIELDFN